MAVSLGEAILKIGADSSTYERKLARLQGLAKKHIDGAATAAINSAKNLMLGAGAVIAGGLVYSIKKGMDAVESENLFEVSLGGMKEQARKWSEDLSKNLGLNQFELRKNVGMFDTMFKSMGLSEQAAYDMSTGLVKLSYDMASFYNLNPDEAFQKLRAGISGEAEPLKQLGILVNETTTKAYALANGIGTVTGGTEANKRELKLLSDQYKANISDVLKSKKSNEEKRMAVEKLNIAYEKSAARLSDVKVELSETDKVMARYGLIMQSTQLAQGDLERTQGSLTNQIRIMKSRLEEAGATLGMKLIPPLTELVNKANEWMKANLDAYVKKIGDGLTKWIPPIVNTVKWLAEHAKTLAIVYGSIVGISLMWKAATKAIMLYKLAAMGIDVVKGLGKEKAAKAASTVAKSMTKSAGDMVGETIAGAAGGGAAGKAAKSAANKAAREAAKKGATATLPGAAEQMVMQNFPQATSPAATQAAKKGIWGALKGWGAKGAASVGLGTAGLAGGAAVGGGLAVGTLANEHLGIRKGWMKLTGNSDAALKKADGAISKEEIEANRQRARAAAGMNVNIQKIEVNAADVVTAKNFEEMLIKKANKNL